MKPIGTTPGKEWAHKLRTEYLAGGDLLPIQIVMASDAIGETWGVDERTRKRFAVQRQSAAA